MSCSEAPGRTSHKHGYPVHEIILNKAVAVLHVLVKPICMYQCQLALHHLLAVCASCFVL